MHTRHVTQHSIERAHASIDLFRARAVDGSRRGIDVGRDPELRVAGRVVQGVKGIHAWSAKVSTVESN